MPPVSVSLRFVRVVSSHHGSSLGPGNFHYLCRYGKQIINIMENLFDVILNSLESQSKGREHFTVCLTLEAETLNIPFDI